MPKPATVYICESCGSHSPKWLGRCPTCGEWNSFVEEVVKEEPQRKGKGPPRQSVPLSSVSFDEGQRLSTSLPELDRVMGGGILEGSVTLIGGDPGVGKSTLLLQVFGHLGKSLTALYVSGEESLAQLGMRAKRLQIESEKLHLLSETSLDAVFAEVERLNPSALAVDSIQTASADQMQSAPGSLSQVRECSVRLTELAKSRGMPTFLVGHITKDGMLAGPKALEHIVDTVLYFEGDRYRHLKILRAAKNRFGATHEVALLEMTGQGLKAVENPSEALLADRPIGQPGSVIGIAMQGTRPLLFEVQALTSPSAFGMAKRMSAGLDRNRVQLLTAVLERSAGMTLGDRDLFVNVVGGVEVVETSLDLPLCLSIASAYRGKPVPPDLAAFGEVGLTGEVRATGNADRRIAEALSMKFGRCILPRSDYERMGQKPRKLSVEPVSSLREAVEAALS